MFQTFQIPEHFDLAAVAHSTGNQPKRSREPFVKGPVPLSWIYAAGALPGKALAVGLLLWHEAGCSQSRTVPLRISKARNFGIHHDTAKRAWKALEQAGLISVRHINGRCLEVTILDAPIASRPPKGARARHASEGCGAHLDKRLLICDGAKNANLPRRRNPQLRKNENKNNRNEN